MSKLELNAKLLPKTLETKEDYEQVSENFVLPFLHRQAAKIAEIITELHTVVSEKEVKPEVIEEYVNKIKEAAAFIHEDSPMNPFFMRLLALEERLEKEGAFDNDHDTNK